MSHRYGFDDFGDDDMDMDIQAPSRARSKAGHDSHAVPANVIEIPEGDVTIFSFKKLWAFAGVRACSDAYALLHLPLVLDSYLLISHRALATAGMARKHGISRPGILLHSLCLCLSLSLYFYLSLYFSLAHSHVHLHTRARTHTLLPSLLPLASHTHVP